MPRRTHLFARRVAAHTRPDAARIGHPNAKAFIGGLPHEVLPFTDMPPAPPRVQQLLNSLHKADAWDSFAALRSYVLDNVVSAGPGVPTRIPPERVQDMLLGSKQGSPFEIVAAQVMGARWLGIPARIVSTRAVESSRHT